jgi:hypothetical protein
MFIVIIKWLGKTFRSSHAVGYTSFPGCRLSIYTHWHFIVQGTEVCNMIYFHIIGHLYLCRAVDQCVVYLCHW